MSKLDKEQVLEQFTAAYTKANGKAPTIEAKGGWYSIDGGKNIRLAQVEELTGELSASKTTTPPPSEPKAKVKAEPAKKATAPKKAVKKAKSKGSFSVKAMWAEKIEATNPGSQAPR